MQSEPDAATEPLTGSAEYKGSASNDGQRNDAEETSNDASFSTTDSLRLNHTASPEKPDSAARLRDVGHESSEPELYFGTVDAGPRREENHSTSEEGLDFGQHDAYRGEQTAEQAPVESRNGSTQSHEQLSRQSSEPLEQHGSANEMGSAHRSSDEKSHRPSESLPLESTGSPNANTPVEQKSLRLSVAAVDDADDDFESTTAPSFRELLKGSRSSASMPRHTQYGSRVSSLSSQSSRSTLSEASTQAFRRSRTPSIGAKKEYSRSSTPLRGSPVASEREKSPDIFGSLAVSPNHPINGNSATPLDNIDRLLVSQSPPAPSSRSSARLPLRLGLLSFNEQEFDETETNADLSAAGSARLQSKYRASTENGVRRHEDRIRKLETENMELKLKLQQYREMNASEQEITRVKGQVDRAERRIDELEEALERKNRTIRELIEERDILASQVRPEHEIEELQSTILDLQSAVSELEAQSLVAEEAARETAAAVTETHSILPNLIGPNAEISDLVAALKQIHGENMRLGGVEQALEKISQHLSDSGRLSDDPVVDVSRLLHDVAQLDQNLADALGTISHERKRYTRETELLKESQRQQVDALLSAEDQLRQQLAKSQNTQAVLKTKVGELEDVVENQHRIIGDTRAENYSIVRRFFSELIDVMGAEFQAHIEAELQKVIETAQAQGVSKLPLLNDLLLQHTRQIAEEAVRSYTAPAVDLKVRAMEQEVHSLEHMLELRLDKSGADAILMAQNRELRRALKLEQEKRKTDWNEFTKTVAAIR